ncbi:MAG: KEOPS complex subunit Pcc1 [Halobacteriota archaeon]
MTDEHTISLSFEYPTASIASRIERAVRVEEGDVDDDRAAACVDRTGASVRVEITARDLIALRAGLNSWIRLIDVAESVEATVSGAKIDGSAF